jgi:uncharacterized protein (DUF1697 family)
MPRYLAFLRGINLGKRRVKMERLREVFEELDFTNVETFIASGNVIFDTTSKKAQTLEAKIEAQVKQTLGFESATFLRTPAEIQAIVQHQPFPVEDMTAAHAVHVAFLREPPKRETADRLLALRTDVDEFHVHGREFFWLCRVSTLDSKVSASVLGKACPLMNTTRNLTMLRRLAAKYAEGPA